MYLTPCNVNEICTIVKEIKNSASPGCDGVTKITIYDEIKQVLVELINMVLSTRSFHEELKVTKIISVYKKGRYLLK